MAFFGDIFEMMDKIDGNYANTIFFIDQIRSTDKYH